MIADPLMIYEALNKYTTVFVQVRLLVKLIICAFYVDSIWNYLYSQHNIYNELGCYL